MNSRRLARDYETLPGTSEAVILWSMTMRMGRSLARHPDPTTRPGSPPGTPPDPPRTAVRR